ncbi:prephenate dehydrogenase/arogenate dehydrogenase family protein [bacterium]|nr:prephenate dehydrogenase/arogenate dehydrogenase family protein [bacterium]
MAKLDELRDSIARLDGEILDLIARRLEAARQVGEIKSEMEVPIRDFPVEARVKDRLVGACEERGVDPELGRELAVLLIEHAVRLQTGFRDLSTKKGSGRALILGGLGKMGAWMAAYLHATGHQVQIFDKASGASDFEIVEDLSAAEGADIVVLALPMHAIAPALEAFDPAKVTGLVFDIASLKTPLVKALRDAGARGLRVASVHPMFGPDAEHLIGRNLIFCDCGAESAVPEARLLFEDVGANLVELSLEEHDRQMGYVLGLAHLTSILYAQVLAGSGLDFEQLGRVASTTFGKQNATALDVMRENPDLYFDIQHHNAASPELARRLREGLGEILDAIDGGDRARFHEIMSAGRAYFLD